MTAADTDVRPGRHTPAASPRGAGSLRLARLLLHLLADLARKLDRKAVLPLSLAVSLMPACVIPAGPEWHDPLGIPNAAPEIFNPIPGAGDAIGAPATRPPEFSFWITDVNGDDLFVRPFANGTQITTSDLPFKGVKGVPMQHRVGLTVTCPNISDKTITSHKIKAAVADREFTDDDPSDPMKVPEGGKVTVITWTLNMTCPL